jgi:hypothetical protein
MSESKTGQSSDIHANIERTEEQPSQDKLVNSLVYEESNIPRKLLRHKPLTTYEVVTLLLSVVGLFSLFLIAKQVKAANEQAQSANEQAQLAKIQTKALTTQHVMTELYELDKVFIDYPHLRPYFYDGKEMSDSDADYGRVRAIAEFQLDFFDSFLTQSEYLTLKPDELENWRTYIKDSFRNSPAMCRRLKGVEGWYNSELEDIAKSNCLKGTL